MSSTNHNQFVPPMSSPPNASVPDPLSPTLSRTSISEASSAYPHQSLPRRSHSERSQQRSSYHYGRDHDLPPLPQPDISSEARRQSMMATDRKRRLTASSQETGRRRTTTGGFTSRDNRFYHTPSRHSSHNSASSTHGSSGAEIIDLTGSSPPSASRSTVPRRPGRTSSNSSRGYLVPAWQPDNDVSECPICRRQFTFLFRRHHCRKCGRVVCNECSPHRITIPRQYIVHPPGEEEGLSSNTVDLTGDDDEIDGLSSIQSRMNQALGGGEKVRLCNPCVPDPQPDLLSVFGQPVSRPLPPAPNHGSPHSPTGDISRYPPQILPPPPQIFPSSQFRPASRPLDAREQPLPQLPHPGNRVHIESEDDDDELDSTSEAYHVSMGRRAMATPAAAPSQTRYHPNSYVHSRYHSLDAARSHLPPHPRMQSMLEASRRYYNNNLPPTGQAPTLFPSGQPSSSSTPAPRSNRPRVREEDICPICRGLLPPKGVNGDETDRESHIMSCISQHDSTATPPLQQRARSSTQTHTFANVNSGLAPHIPVSASLPTSPPPRAMPMQMLRFVATEKDCGAKTDGEGTGVDVQPQECSICMVEYEVGERLARLECWCKFHEECIVEWFGRKRECPVHKLG